MCLHALDMFLRNPGQIAVQLREHDAPVKKGLKITVGQ